MAHSVNYELELGNDPGDDFTVKTEELGNMQRLVMTLADLAEYPQPRLRN